jgi:hypothetical protein
MFRKLFFYFGIWFYLAPRKKQIAGMMLNFLNSRNLVGSNLERIFYRFRDLRKIEKMGLLGSQSILELGTGSSTIFFLNLKELRALNSFEENAQWLLSALMKYSGQNWMLTISPMEIYQVNGIRGNKYVSNLPLDVNFIYVDGPSTVNFSGNISSPNLDLGMPHNHADERTIIAIDARISTTIFLKEIYEETHVFLPSSVFIDNWQEIMRESHSPVVLNLQGEMESCLSIGMTRTSLLVPKQLLSVK